MQELESVQLAPGLPGVGIRRLFKHGTSEPRLGKAPGLHEGELGTQGSHTVAMWVVVSAFWEIQPFTDQHICTDYTALLSPPASGLVSVPLAHRVGWTHGLCQLWAWFLCCLPQRQKTLGHGPGARGRLSSADVASSCLLRPGLC